MIKPRHKHLLNDKFIARNTQIVSKILMWWYSPHMTEGQRNEWRPVLKEGEVYCARCDGTGYEPDQNYTEEWLELCHKCEGDGKVDWVTNIMEGRV